MDWKEASGKFSKLTEAIAAKVEELEYVRAFWIHGSRAAGAAREQSGIDYAFIITDRRRYDELKREFSRHIRWRDVPGPHPEQSWEVAIWKESGDSFNEVGWHVMVEEDLKPYERLYSDRHTPHQGERWVEPFHDTHLLRYQGRARYYFMDSLIIYDPEGLVERVRELVSTYPDKVAGGVKKWALDRLRKRVPWHGNPWIARGPVEFTIDIREDLHYIAIAHYARNKRFPNDRLKRYDQELDELKPALKGLITKLLTIDEEDKRPIMHEIIEELDKEDGY